MRVESLNPLELTDGDVAHWRALLAADSTFTSPYLTPDWAQAVARRRSDALVAVFRNQDESPVAFLPVQRSGAFAALPLGGPVCDYQALIGPRDIDVPLAAKAL